MQLCCNVAAHIKVKATGYRSLGWPLAAAHSQVDLFFLCSCPGIDSGGGKLGTE